MVKTIEDQKKRLHLNIGADPEWAIARKNPVNGEYELDDARAFLIDNGILDTVDEDEEEDDAGLTSQIGHDGHTSVGEFRPTPSWANGTENLKDNISTLIKQLPKYDLVQYMTGPHYKDEPLGGHLHISGDDLFNIEFSSYKNCQYHVNYEAGAMWASCLTATLDSYLIPLLYCVYRRLDTVKRYSIGYGHPGSWRKQGKNYIEYRTPPSWLSTPYLVGIIEILSRRITTLWRTEPDFYHKFTPDGAPGLSYSDYLCNITNITRGISQTNFVKKLVLNNLSLLDNYPTICTSLKKFIEAPPFLRGRMSVIDLDAWGRQ